jgi:hypothetical protein
MPERPETNLQQAFHERLLEAISELRRYTRAGLSETSRRINTSAGLDIARSVCRRTEGTSDFSQLANQPGQLFCAARRVGRIDLSIEAIVLESQWASLFTQRELEAAAERLREQRYTLPVQPCVLSQTTDLVLMGQSFSQFTLSH